MIFSLLQLKLCLVLLIIFVFVTKLLMVSLYQQKSGDYFTNKLFNGYSKLEINACAIDNRRVIMARANWLNIALWICSGLLAFFMLW